MQQVEQIIDQVTDTLSDIAQSDVVVGTPVVVGNVTLVPISRITAGFAGAGGEGEGDAPKSKSGAAGSGVGRGAGSGGGAIVRPVAVAVFSEANVEVLSIAEKQGKLEKFLDQMPDLIERFKKSSD